MSGFRRRLVKVPDEDVTAAKARVKESWDELAQAKSNLEDAILLARRCGITWTEMGLIFGMVRQGAHRRFKHIDELL